MRARCTGPKEEEEGKSFQAQAVLFRQTTKSKQLLLVKNSPGGSTGWMLPAAPSSPGAGVSLEPVSSSLFLLFSALMASVIPVQQKHSLTYTVSLVQEPNSGFNGLMDSEEV